MHCAIDQAILDSTGPGIPASQKVAKIESILVASDTCTPETNPCSTQKGSAFSHAYILDKPTSSDVTALSDSQEGYAPRRAHSHMSAFSDAAKEAAFSDVAAFSDAQKRCAPRQAHRRDKSVFSDTAKKAAFSNAQKIGAPRHAQSHDRSAFSDSEKNQRLVTLQLLASLRKEVHPIIRTAATSPCLATPQENQRLVTLQR